MKNTETKNKTETETPIETITKPIEWEELKGRWKPLISKAVTRGDLALLAMLLLEELGKAKGYVCKSNFDQLKRDQPS